MPANYNDVVRFAQFVINTWLRKTNHKKFTNEMIE